MNISIRHFAIVAGLSAIAMQFSVGAVYAAQEGTNKGKPGARNPNAEKLGNFEIQDIKSSPKAKDLEAQDKMGNFEIQLINSPRDSASGQATGIVSPRDPQSGLPTGQ